MDLHESEDSLVYVVSSGLLSAIISDLFLETLSSRVQKPCFNISASLPVLRLFPIVMEKVQHKLGLGSIPVVIIKYPYKGDLQEKS